MQTFESLLADVQSEMIAAALEYADGAASDIYVFCSAEKGALYFDVFFVADGAVVESHKLPGIDTSIPRQKALIRYGGDQLDRLFEFGRETGQPIPTQIKMHYSVDTKSLDADFAYENLYSDHPNLHTTDLFAEWQREVQESLSASPDRT